MKSKFLKIFTVILNFLISYNCISFAADFVPMEENEDLEKVDEIYFDPNCTIKNFIETALLPVGKVMYIWGGGWNKSDDGAGIEAMSYGISRSWLDFTESHKKTDYNFKNFRYLIHNGLDCSGFVGWVCWNIFGDSYNEAGYVRPSAEMASFFSKKYEWGNYRPSRNVSDWEPGDIMSMDGHVWISLGECKDGSVLLVHSSPPGVKISGTRNSDGSKSDAVMLAEKIMQKKYPEWYKFFPDCGVNYSYILQSNQMRWNTNVLHDEENFQGMSAEKIAETVFGISN